MSKAAPTDRLIAEARTFLTALAAENTRDWFQAHKAEYDTQLKAPAQALLDELAPEIGALMEAGPAKTKIFRPNRDVRFSKDKTPYTTHLHMLWWCEGEERQSPGFFFGLSPDYLRAGGGLMTFEREVLEDWRKLVDLDGDRIEAIVAEAEAQGLERREPDLKRVPPPFPKDHPHGDLLRMKGLTLWRDLDAGGDLVAQLRATFTALAPVQRLLAGL